MATLVLSTVGTALGGPIGSAIGALIGQSIDQEVLAPVRRGPRVGDLSVQTSSYGTQIPRIYGTMRVAGSVVWATDLIEHENVDGAKGQPDVTYSYTVSLAVALSSRPGKSIGRIWADGKLLRGAAGDLKVGGTFRLYEGSEDQAVDPFIASAEGIGGTPAYRGLALAVFENLELGEFGNRIPFFTFEVVADEEPPTLGSIIMDASGGVISCDAEHKLIGFAAYGRSIRSAVEPLVESYGVEPFDDGTTLRSAGGGAPLTIGDNELGNRVDADEAPRLHREQLPVRSVPTVLRLTYYDPARDYQTGDARAVAGEQSGNELQRELPAVLAAADAKSLAQQILVREWARRDRLTLRLPPSRIGLEPGTVLDLPLSPARWTVEKTIVDGFVLIAELRPSAIATAVMVADPGRIVGNRDVAVGPVNLALLDIPGVLLTSAPTVFLAASAPTAGWKTQTVRIDFVNQSVVTETARPKSRLGRALTALATAETSLIDDQNGVDVELIDADQWLTSCDDDALAAGANLAVLASELIQFGTATPLGSGRFRLSRLLRGRGGTEWACAGHTNNDLFCLIQAASLQPVTLASWSVGAPITATITGAASGNGASIDFTAEALRPPSPVHLHVEQEPSGDLMISWTRRSRQGFAWIDSVDAPLGEAREQYRVSIAGALSTIELLSDLPGVTLAATAVAALGSGPATVEVRQIGDFAASRPAQLTFNNS